MPRHPVVDRHGDDDRSGALGGVIARQPPDPGRHEPVAADDDAAPLDMAHDAFTGDLRDLRGHR